MIFIKFKRNFKTPLFLLLLIIGLNSCDSITSSSETTITIADLTGIVPPVSGENPVSTITETAQFTGTIMWSDSPENFQANTVYTATITLTAKADYTFNGVQADFFTVTGATTVTNQENSGVVTATFPATALAVIDIADIQGIIVPALGETPVTSISETEQYSGTVNWNDSPEIFAPNTAYTATISLTAKKGYTLVGVEADFFTLTGADSVSNAANSGIITAVFPATAAPTPVNFISAVQIGGNHGTTNSTALTLTFSEDITNLADSNITVVGATKGELSGTGTTRNLSISNISADNAGTVTVTIANTFGFEINNPTQEAIVYRKLVIGLKYQGGIIADFFFPNDPGYIEGEVHGFVVSSVELSEAIQWYNGTYASTGAIQEGYGYGLTNTNAIINAQGSGNYAAKLCADYTNIDTGTGVYSDWVLPSKNELYAIYARQFTIFGYNPRAHYWSSTESSDSTSWAIRFSTGERYELDKANALRRVWAIRYF